MLSSSRPADLTAAGIATAGPTPMMAGSTPTAAKVLQGHQVIKLIFYKQKMECRTYFRDNAKWKIFIKQLD